MKDMAFSEKIKLEVKQKADFKCCRCRSIGVQVHHIVPQENGGSDNIENAAPLCPNCHDYFGANPKKRKEITQMRDYWYKRVSEIYTPKSIPLEKLLAIDTTLEEIRTSTQALPELKALLREVAENTIDNMTAGTAVVTASGIVNTSTATSATSTKLGDRVHANMECKNCRTSIGLLIGTNKCPNCGQDIF
jgi:Zn finger protein HypA/HybF involved in hydrogenase expression